jgi:hypothetical protein
MPSSWLRKREISVFNGVLSRLHNKYPTVKLVHCYLLLPCIQFKHTNMFSLMCSAAELEHIFRSYVFQPNSVEVLSIGPRITRLVVHLLNWRVSQGTSRLWRLIYHPLNYSIMLSDTERLLLYIKEKKDISKTPAEIFIRHMNGNMLPFKYPVSRNRQCLIAYWFLVLFSMQRSRKSFHGSWFSKFSSV